MRGEASAETDIDAVWTPAVVIFLYVLGDRLHAAFQNGTMSLLYQVCFFGGGGSGRQTF